MDSDVTFWWLTAILQVGFLLRLLVCAPGVRWLDTLASWWHAANFQVDKQMLRDLDLLRCRMTCRTWYVACSIGMGRIVIQQSRLAFGFLGTSRLLPEFDYLTIFSVFIGLLLLWRPSSLNPQTLDVWYVVTSLISIAMLIPVADTDARDVLNLTFGFRIFFAVLTKHSWCWIVCTAAASAQILWMANSQGVALMSGILGSLFVAFGMPCLCILAGRWLLYDNIMLRKGLQKKAMELGAVSSLLLVCYDAVVEVDESLKFMEDSIKLSGLLLHSSSIAHGASGLAGKSFLELFGEEDRPRIAEHFAKSISEDAPIMTTNADMLDSDQNHIKVELLHAQFRNHFSERCFLIGVREAQNSEPLSPLRSTYPMRPRDDQQDYRDLHVTFEVPSFEVLALSEDMERLCQRVGSKPDQILDLSCEELRDIFNADLQELVNEMSQGDGNDRIFSFNLLGLGEVQSSFNMKLDEISESFVGSLHVKAVPVPRSSADGRSVQVRSQPRRSRRVSSTVTHGHDMGSVLGRRHGVVEL